MADATFKDLFSANASDYARYRPGYPPALFAHLASLVADHRAAWDCATGNGQAAALLAPHFERVLATDASEKQLAEAAPHPRVHYSLGAAEASGLADQSVTLVTVAQAFHWFRHAAFFAEVRRVARPGQSALALLAYDLARIEPAVDALLDDYYTRVVGEYWEPERRLVEDGYRSIPVPFEELPAPPQAMQARWSAAQLVGYLGTWSATTRARRALGRDPLADLAGPLLAAWGPDPAAEKLVTWPLAVRLFKL